MRYGSDVFPIGNKMGIVRRAPRRTSTKIFLSLGRQRATLCSAAVRPFPELCTRGPRPGAPTLLIGETHADPRLGNRTGTNFPCLPGPRLHLIQNNLHELSSCLVRVSPPWTLRAVPVTLVLGGCLPSCQMSHSVSRWGAHSWGG